MKRKHYAMQWIIDAHNGEWARRCAKYYWFASRFERDNWVSEGAPYRGAGFRESLKSSDLELRRLRNLERTREEVGLWIVSI
jgi:hypothetical protein